MDRRGEDVIRLRRVQHAMVRGVRARDDRLGAQHFARPPLAGLGAYDADQVVLERQLVHDRQAVAVLQHLERRRVLAPVQLDRALARKPEAARAAPVDLDTLPTSIRTTPTRAIRGPKTTSIRPISCTPLTRTAPAGRVPTRAAACRGGGRPRASRGGLGYRPG